MQFQKYITLNTQSYIFFKKNTVEKDADKETAQTADRLFSRKASRPANILNHRAFCKTHF